MPNDYSELYQLAKACDPSWVVDTWWASCDADDEAWAYGPLRKCWPEAAEAKADMYFMAKASPTTIMAMIDEINQLRAKVALLEGNRYGTQ